MASQSPPSCVSMDKPAVFLYTEADGKLCINQEMVQLLSHITSPLCVIAIVGKYRTGKSYLMNRFFETNAGFALGPTIQAATKGIWIWVRPHPLDPSQSLVLLDTEGLHDVERGDATHDMKLFSLALLLSNCLVYNAIGTLDDVIIRQLHLVSELTEHIRTQEHKEEDGNHFNNYFPSFNLVLRDFFLRLEIDGSPCTPDQYLEHALKLKVGQTKRVREYNVPRECMRAFFPRRHCFVLCKPVDDDDMLTCLDRVPDDVIKPAFLDAAKSATNSILSDARPFQVEGHNINGARYVQLTMSYIQAINNGAVPCISSAVELLKQHECEKALDEAASLFQTTMSELIQDRLPVSVEELTTAQKLAHAAALEHYRKRALFDGQQTYLTKLGETLDSLLQSHIQTNNAASVEKCRALLTALFAGVDESIQRGDYMGSGGYTRYRVDREAGEATYSATPQLGPMKENVFNEFLQARQAQEHTIIMADKALSEKEKRLVYEQELRKVEEERARASAAQQKLVMQQLLAQQEAHQEMLHKVQADFTAHQNTLLENHRRDISEKEKEHQRMLSEGLTKQADQYREIIGELKEDQRRQQEAVMRERERMEVLSGSNKELLSAMQEQRKLSDAQMQEMMSRLESLSQQQQNQPQGGFFNLFGSVLGKAVDTLFRT